MTSLRIGTIDALLHRLLLRDGDTVPDGFPQDLLDYAEARVTRNLGMAAEHELITRIELRLRLALHLAPAAAVAYDPANPMPRHRLVESYLSEHFGLERDEAAGLARDVAHTLNIWDEKRDPVTTHAQRLVDRQVGRCGHCCVEFDAIPWTLTTRDVFKPYFEAPKELLLPEVDHVEAISLLGTNDARNLQVLCRLCNLGKGDGLGVSIREELAHARTAVEDLPRGYRIRMLYAIVLRDRGSCTLCFQRVSELTVRLRNEAGSYVRSNLRTVCVGCLR